MAGSVNLLASYGTAVGGSWTFLGSTFANGSSGSTTTTAVNTTGANFIVLGISSTAGQTYTVTDSKGNTPTHIRQDTSGSSQIDMFEFVAPIVGAGHTFSANGSAIFASIYVLYASGSNVVPLDQQNGANSAGATSLQPGSVTPVQNGELIVTAITDFTGTAPTIGSGFTITNAQAFTSAVNYAGGMAYLIQTTAAAINPTWTSFGASIACAASIVSFKHT